MLVIIKNPTSKQLLPDERYDWYYDESAYFGNLEKDSATIMSLGPQFINAHDKQKISDHAREYYFRILATEKDTSGRYKYNCNINDTRFWTCPIWKEIDGIKQARIAFEKEKKEHPENIYEPKR